MQLDTPLTWRHDSERDVFVLEGHIGGQYCHRVLVGEAVENYVNDLNVRYSVNFNLTAYFIPR